MLIDILSFSLYNQYMETEKLLKYCYINAQRKMDTASALMRSKKYADALFFCHLAIEFMLKGKYVEIKKEMFPITHDLENLTRKINIDLSPNQKTDLAEINTFNIAGRYDDYKIIFL